MKLLYSLSLVLFFSYSTAAQDKNMDFEILEDYPAETEDYFLGSILGVGSDSEDNLYVFDFSDRAVKKITKNGEYAGSIIRSGRGPGEVNSIYSYLLDPCSEKIYVADRQNLKYLVTDFNGDELASFQMRPQKNSVAMQMNKYNDSTLALLYSNSVNQTMRSEYGVDSLIHFYNSENFERRYSILDRKNFTKIINYESEAAAFMNDVFVGEITFIDQSTLLLSPYIFNGGVIVYQKNQDKGWSYVKTMDSKGWEAEPFKEIDYDEYRENRAAYRSAGGNISTSMNPEGQAAGIIQLRSVGIYAMGDNTVVNFIVKEKVEGESFHHELYAELYSNDLQLMESQLVYEGKEGELIMGISWKDDKDHFYMHKERVVSGGKILKFTL